MYGQSLSTRGQFETQTFAATAIQARIFCRPSELRKRLSVEAKHLIGRKIAAGIGFNDAAAGGVEAEACSGIFGETRRQRHILEPREESVGCAGRRRCKRFGARDDRDQGCEQRRSATESWISHIGLSISALPPGTEES